MPTPEEIALTRIRDAAENGDTELDLSRTSTSPPCRPKSADLPIGEGFLYL
jgi:hypothetical protein